MSEQLVSLSINGRARPVRAMPFHTLLEVLRDQLQLTGAKRGCNQGICGACTVQVDGQPMRACLSLAVNLADREITTVEGLAAGRTLSAMQQAFVECGAVQCGFCISGMLISASALLRDNPHPSEDDARQALVGNLCRCSGYAKIIEAVCRAGEAAP
ncbi:MAG: (2Fe-2S)-binding domain protein [Rhodospirillales bacterium]|jgi:carbon-monoxide dehydrogenase small subunit|nr:(2Fe-2S)-binding domain protein [Rhodospirillales bacterium]